MNGFFSNHFSTSDILVMFSFKKKSNVSLACKPCTGIEQAGDSDTAESHLVWHACFSTTVQQCQLPRSHSAAIITYLLTFNMWKESEEDHYPKYQTTPFGILLSLFCIAIPTSVNALSIPLTEKDYGWQAVQTDNNQVKLSQGPSEFCL